MKNNKELSKINFFISSTYDDLKPYRNAVINKIQQNSGIINAQEFFGARSQASLDTCMEELEKSDVMILILAHRYGSIHTDTKKSYTELEYNKAKEKNKIILAYLINEEHPWNLRLVDKDKQSLDKFKRIVERDCTINYFTTQNDLAEKVFEDLKRELPKYELIIGEENLNSTDDKLQFLEQMCKMPRLMGGREIVLTVKMEKQWDSTKQLVCDALDLTHGSSIYREFKPIDKDEQRILGWHNNLYAENELAVELSEIPPDKEVKIRMKMQYGFYKKPIYYKTKATFTTVTEMMRAISDNTSYVDRIDYEDKNYSGFIFCSIES
ncbi:DUF4062 domain-containing protein [Thiotrichales bacterium HSG1]|nr:DUF4062 domain-containing protein [Thiotrichales bacterium HSG1]